MNIIPRKKKYSPLESSNESTAAPCHGPIFIKRGRIFLATFIRCFWGNQRQARSERGARDTHERETRRKALRSLRDSFDKRTRENNGYVYVLQRRLSYPRLSLKGFYKTKTKLNWRILIKRQDYFASPFIATCVKARMESLLGGYTHYTQPFKL